MIHAEMEGINEVLQAMNSFTEIHDDKHLVAAVKVGLRQALKPTLETAKAMAPVDTGDLRNNLAIRTSSSKRIQRKYRTLAAGYVGVRKNAPPSVHRRAMSQEFGANLKMWGKTYNYSGKPYLRPALYGNQSSITTDLAPHLKRAIMRKARRLEARNGR